MKLGVVGLPNVGKSTLFNVITKAGAECANYPFCTIEPNIGIVPVPDPRLEKLAALYNSKKVTPTAIEFVDIAGLVRGASKGEGLGNKFLSYIREVDAIVHMVRCFNDENIIHVEGKIDPVSDAATINTELLLSDIESMEKRIAKTQSQAKSGKSELKQLLVFQNKILEHLNNGEPLRTLELEPNELIEVESYFLLTSKKVIYVANVSENDINNQDNLYINALKDVAAKEQAKMIIISCRIEQELLELPEEERAIFSEELGITKSGLDKLVTTCYDMLGLISYLTAGEKETRAWTILKGTKAPQAAGKIHTDFEKGFIRAEIITYEDLLEYRSYSNAKEKGKVRSEGKGYVVKDGDVVLFRFNV